jgi:hypothetical protein
MSIIESQLNQGERTIQIIKRNDAAEKREKVRRHFKALMILLADLEPDDYLEVADRLSSNSVLTDKAA